MPIFADVAGHDILNGWGSAFLLAFLLIAAVGGLVGWFCGYLYRRSRRR